MNEYEQKQEAKRVRLERAADRAATEADSRFKAANAAVAGIPLGQPILVDHHSAPRHRAALRRQDAHMRKASEALERAKDLRRRAASVGDAGISSDDPDAVAKLTAKAEQLRAECAMMARANAAYRTATTTDSQARAAAARDELLALTDKSFDWWSVELTRRGRGVGDGRPFPAFSMTNRRARLRDAEKRIATLTARDAERAALAEAGAKAPARRLFPGGISVVDDVLDNRVAIVFPREPKGAPASLSAAIKARGWKWSPTRGAWVRMRSSAGVFALACSVVERWLAERQDAPRGS